MEFFNAVGVCLLPNLAICETELQNYAPSSTQTSKVDETGWMAARGTTSYKSFRYCHHSRTLIYRDAKVYLILVQDQSTGSSRTGFGKMHSR
ncbi:hypothetical protein BDR04DRAFT_1091522 [Suillus decipiens]|nr:hypothetical protein BDR04DRAFT_1091522 [Suillus decipiens]